MFRSSKFRLNSCRIILVTSLVWFVVDVIILAFYFDTISNLNKSRFAQNEKNRTEWQHDSRVVGVDEAGLRKEQLVGNFDSHHDEIRTYRPTELQNWKPPRPVKIQYGKPGEEGRGVQLRDVKETIVEEKFKLNQFNILASDKISLNRSLTDVRNDK